MATVERCWAIEVGPPKNRTLDWSTFGASEDEAIQAYVGYFYNWEGRWLYRMDNEGVRAVKVQITWED